jgi:hypothetical protein
MVGNEKPVRSLPHKTVCASSKAAVQAVYTRMSPIQSANNTLWIGHKKDWTTGAGKGRNPSAVRLIHSCKDATPIKVVSGKAQILPGVVLDDSTRTDRVEYWTIGAKRLVVIPRPPRTREESRPDPAAAQPSDR